jgi:hypothetical protein
MSDKSEKQKAKWRRIKAQAVNDLVGYIGGTWGDWHSTGEHPKPPDADDLPKGVSFDCSELRATVDVPEGVSFEDAEDEVRRPLSTLMEDLNSLAGAPQVSGTFTHTRYLEPMDIDGDGIPMVGTVDLLIQVRPPETSHT